MTFAKQKSCLISVITAKPLGERTLPDNNNNNNNNNYYYLLPSVFTRLHAVIISLVSLNLMTLITRLHLQSPRAFRD